MTREPKRLERKTIEFIVDRFDKFISRDAGRIFEFYDLSFSDVYPVERLAAALIGAGRAVRSKAKLS